MTPRDVLVISYLGAFLAILSALLLAGLSYLAYRGADRLHRAIENGDRRRDEFAAEACEPYDSAAGVAGVAAAGALTKACCERWWTSAGADHDLTCPNHWSHA